MSSNEVPTMRRSVLIFGLVVLPILATGVEQDRTGEFKEEEVTFDNGNVRLRGTLVLPTGKQRSPAVIVLGGSNWETRKDVRFVVDNFAPRGLAVLIFDQRSYGQSTGERFGSFSDLAQDALAAVKLLRARDDIDPQHIGLLGMSRGGWIAPLAASLSGDVGFLILFVAPAVSPAKQEQMRVENEMRADGFALAEIEQASEFIRLKFAWGRTGRNWLAYSDAVQRSRNTSWFEYVGGPIVKESAAWRFIQLNGDYDPAAALARIRCPVLAIFGALDRNVLPEVNVPIMERAFRAAGNRDYLIKVIPNANHALLLSTSGGRKEVHHTEQFAPEVSDTVNEWLNKKRIVAD